MAGIIDTIKFAGILVFAIPAALAGLEFAFVRDEPLIGGTLLVLAVGLVLIDRLLTMPSDIPTMVAKRVAGSVASEPDSDTDEPADRE
ncbi:hypothetical protein HALLA_16385 [Halostagnicola larsenii XH-48]|uniref:Uncharacterized protein n=1 Tax=Halostagnicola larsenii XH-48 TaxID=797299 RepID=W0JS68_9EURY|nr:hypothetical protein [Halostagnicola larsenii]AHG00142.1 hypothetical protein HALLA_16385 [Halostagnicola larsenii XH-48]